MTAPVTITAENWSTTVLNADKPVLVDFWAEWCGPCRRIGPVLEEIASEYGDKFVIGKVNVDEQRSLAAMWQVMSIPALMFFSNGNKAGELIGVHTKEDIVAKLQSLA
ncbi:thioredoxin [Corynebacterium choanae]|uniref:Thioredoxin n=1 Tax=Corynebacterium choanae TaxID=1862358 RepID=A0A3G6J9D0_9CORY|nr:thioredoxin [Corynebacterium choanae]AZA14731.1 Thioredoxin-1 [Corynebacterium choanae]